MGHDLDLGERFRAERVRRAPSQVTLIPTGAFAAERAALAPAA